MPEPPDRLASALADRYRIERELGQGGMATVYLAEDLKHQRKVAIKVLRSELSALVFEGDGRIGDYAGGYTDWMQDKAKEAARAAVLKGGARPPDGLASSTDKNLSGGQVPPKKKLSGKEQKELEALPAKIEALEKEQAELTAQLADPAFYKAQAAKFAAVKSRLEAVEKEHVIVFARWEELEAGRG